MFQFARDPLVTPVWVLTREPENQLPRRTCPRAAAPASCGHTSSVAPAGAGASAPTSPGAPRTPPTPGVEAPDSASQARRDPPARSAAGDNHGARPSARDATPESPASLSDPSAPEAAPTRTGYGPRERQTTRAHTPPGLTAAEATRRDRSTPRSRALGLAKPGPSLILARVRETEKSPRRPARAILGPAPPALLPSKRRISARSQATRRRLKAARVCSPYA
jgi:hypothetical protein